MFADRPASVRLLASALFAGAALAFLLPFLAVQSDLRFARATGGELVRQTAPITGRYVHDAYRGEVERLVDRGRTPSLLAFAAAVAGLALAWLPWRVGPALGLAFGLLGDAAMFALYQSTSASFAPPEIDHRYGFWAAFGLFGLAALWSALVFAKSPWWWKPSDEPRRDYFAPSDERERSPGR